MSTQTQTNTNRIIEYQTERGAVKLSIAAVKQLFCPEATDTEAYYFLRLCQFQKLNPFLKEAYLIKYDPKKPASIVVGKETFTQRAEQHPAFVGYRAGIVVERDGESLDLEGALPGRKDILIGGWCAVIRKDREQPFIARVAFGEYDTHQSSWVKMPATMIRKVALVQALREAFATSLAGLSDAAELDTEVPDAIEGQVLSMEDAVAEVGELQRQVAGPKLPYQSAKGSDSQVDFPPDGPPRMPDRITSYALLEATLKNHGWTMAILAHDLLQQPWSRYLSDGGSVADAYLIWREHTGL